MNEVKAWKWASPRGLAWEEVSEHSEGVRGRKRREEGEVPAPGRRESLHGCLTGRVRTWFLMLLSQKR